MSQRTAVLIDNGYLHPLIRDQFNDVSLDYLKLSTELCKGSSRFRTYIYDCLPYRNEPPTAKENERFSKAQNFYYALSAFPAFEIRLGRLRPRGNTFVQKGVDVMLAIDMIRLSAKHVVDRIALVSGDSDFVPAVQAAKDEGIFVTLYHSQTRRPELLWRACDERYPIDRGLIDRCLVQMQNVPSSSGGLATQDARG